MQVEANGITLEVEEYGPRDGIPLILIRGLGSQLIHWPQGLYRGFGLRGYRTIIFDNRDAGLSQNCPAPGVSANATDIAAAIKRGEVPKAAYGLDDMARDVVGLMDALDIGRAHIFGISMGGGIAQFLALQHAARLASATLVVTSAELRNPDALLKMLARPATREQAQETSLAGDAAWGSPGYPRSRAEIRTEAALAHDRGWSDEAENRQILAIMALPDLRKALTGIGLPCYVIHGAEDTLIPPDQGRNIAALIPGAKLDIIDGMGHVITPLLAPLIIDKVDTFIRQNSR